MLRPNHDLESLYEAVECETQDGPVAEALATWGNYSPVVYQDGKWLPEGVIAYFQGTLEIVRAVDPSVPLGLLPHCLDPHWIRHFSGKEVRLDQRPHYFCRVTLPTNSKVAKVAPVGLPVTSCTPSTTGGDSVEVVYGADEFSSEQLVAKTVAWVRRSFAGPFGIPTRALPYVRGHEVRESYRLQAGDFLEFLVRFGRKGTLEPAELEKLEALAQAVRHVSEQVTALQEAVSLLVSQRTVKDWYTTQDIATMFGRAEYTVREWCRLGRIKAKKAPCVRGGEQEWRVAHEELLRYQKEGLLPIARKY